MKAVVIGAGRMGRRHMQSVRSIGLELVGVCDVKRNTLREAAAELELDERWLFDDAATMLREVRPECVVVATTAPTHSEFTCVAAESGAKFVLCEKPMAVSLAQCDQMIETCEHEGVKLAVNHQMRFMEQYSEPKAILNSESFGGLCSVTVLGGNFGLAMNGSHYFETFRYLTDEAPLDVTAWFSPDTVPNPRGGQFEDRAGAVRVTTLSGTRLYLEASSDQGHGMTTIYCGRNGQLIVNELTGAIISSVRDVRHRSLPTTRYGMSSIEETRNVTPADAVSPSKEVLRALITGNSPPSGEDGRQAMEVLVAAHVSNEEGHRTVRLAHETLPRDRRFAWP